MQIKLVKASEVDKPEICRQYGITMERLNEQYAANANDLKKMMDKALSTGKKVNGYTADQLKERYETYLDLSK